jgi:multicomponent Na+:H+ antiporter subunit C
MCYGFNFLIVTFLQIDYTLNDSSCRFNMLLNMIYILAVIVLCTGLYIMIADNNYIRRIIGLGIFQTSCLIFFIALGKVNVGVIPFEKCIEIEHCAYAYSAALPHVLMLTAIVVGFATLGVALALIYRINADNLT